MILKEIIDRIKFWKTADRIGPDIPYTHWHLHFKSKMKTLCQRKFKYFADTAEFRPGAYAITCSKISLGARVIIRPGSMLFADPREDGAGITIEDGAMVGSGVHLYANNHRFDDPDVPIIDQGHYPSEAILIRKGCWLGANVVVLPGVTIGENTVVGAGSVVNKDLPARVLAAGNPARPIRAIGEAKSGN